MWPIRYSCNFPFGASDPSAADILSDVSEKYLREVVETISVPRHFGLEAHNNVWVAEWITYHLTSWGYKVYKQGLYNNILALPEREDISEEAKIMVGAHYDSVPNTPGADDNASGVAAMLACAKAIAQHAFPASVCFVAFNREEDNILGSWDFVRQYLSQVQWHIRQVYILEMVGYSISTPKTQRLPYRMPAKLVNSTANFLAILGNRQSKNLVRFILQQARCYLPEFQAIGVNIPLGIEKILHEFLRSDHAPFWKVRIPAVVWTDTSEYRNPHYHKLSDTPDTLDYDFLCNVSKLLLACVLHINLSEF